MTPFLTSSSNVCQTSFRILSRQPNNVWSDLKHVYVWEEKWAVVSRDDVDGEFPILTHELLSAESGDNDKTYELLDDYIITELTGRAEAE